MRKVKCTICNRMVDPRGLPGHMRKHEKSPNPKIEWPTRYCYHCGAPCHDDRTPVRRNPSE